MEFSIHAASVPVYTLDYACYVDWMGKTQSYSYTALDTYFI